MISRPISAAKKRAPMARQIQDFRKCACKIINNCLNRQDRELYRPLEVKKPKFMQIGITTRIAATSCKVALTEQAQKMMNHHLITMQNKYNGRTVQRILEGGKCVKLTRLNTKGKTEWVDGVKKVAFQIFPNITEAQLDETRRNEDK